MGVCLLGNYNFISPAPAGLESVKQLIAWKLDKEDLDPMSFFLHPADAEDADTLDVISGHRDGCATDCPGNFYYVLKDSLRNEVKTYLDSCGVLGITEAVSEQIHVFPNPAGNRIFITSSLPVSRLILFNISGQKMAEEQVSGTAVQLNCSAIPSGLYILQIDTQKGTFRRKVLKK